MQTREILERLPYDAPFLFVDELESVSDQGAQGSCHFVPEMWFYAGHFKSAPITPGVILTEAMAQIGLVCLGIYLTADAPETSGFVMTATEIEFLKPVYPPQKIRVISSKIYFRFNKLKCRVTAANEFGDVVAQGTISGMIRTVL